MVSCINTSLCMWQRSGALNNVVPRYSLPLSALCVKEGCSTPGIGLLQRTCGAMGKDLSLPQSWVLVSKPSILLAPAPPALTRAILGSRFRITVLPGFCIIRNTRYHTIAQLGGPDTAETISYRQTLFHRYPIPYNYSYAPGSYPSPNVARSHAGTWKCINDTTKMFSIIYGL